MLDEALSLNRAALTLPFQSSDQLVVLSHNIWEHYQSLLVDRPVAIEEGIFVYRVASHGHTWESVGEWAQHLQWAQGKDKRGYMRTVINPRRARRPAVEALPARVSTEAS